MADFRRACAAALDAGAPTDEVMARLRARYTTPQSLRVQTCLVRQLCAPTPAHAAAVEALLATASDAAARDALADAVARRGRGCDPATRERIAALPHRLPANAYALRVTHEEVRAVKRQAALGRLAKNRKRRRVDGRALLAEARGVLVADGGGVVDLALALMLLTGRRTCEILNGTSVFEAVGAHALRFDGQAKRRGVGGAYVVPSLAPAEAVVAAIARLRARQGHATLSNAATSRRYQGTLSRRVKARWPEVGCPHGLRGVYACAALRLFDFGDASDAYAAMSVLGHRGVHESLVYTPFHLGDGFGDEPTLGSFVLPDEEGGDGEGDEQKAEVDDEEATAPSSPP
jgi:hypothetical protein